MRDISEYSLQKRERIKRKEEISTILSNGEKWKSLLFTIMYSRNEITYDRIGILLSRENGKATERNRVKRVFREVFRRNKLRYPPFYDILIRPRFEALEKKFTEIEDSYRKWIQSAKK